MLKTTTLFAALALAALAMPAAAKERVPDNPLIDYAGFSELVGDLGISGIRVGAVAEDDAAAAEERAERGDGAADLGKRAAIGGDDGGARGVRRHRGGEHRDRGDDREARDGDAAQKEAT